MTRSYKETTYRTAMEMVRDHENGMSFTAIGRKHGYHRTTVSRIVAGHRILVREGVEHAGKVHPRRGLNDLRHFLTDKDPCLLPKTDGRPIMAAVLEQHSKRPKPPEKDFRLNYIDCVPKN